MQLPAINEITASVVHTDAFRGYNHNRIIRDDEFFDMENLSGDEYPLLAPRKPRRLRRSFQKPHGLHAHEKLCWVDGTDLYYDGSVKGTVEDSDKQFVSMGAYIIIWPDKKLFDSKNEILEDLGALDASALPVWDNLGGMPELTKISVAISGKTVECMRINTMKGAFREKDTVRIRYQEWIEGKDDPSDGEAIDRTLDTNVVYVGTEGDHGFVYLPYDEEFSFQYTQSMDMVGEEVTLERPVPDMDYICEMNNRLWGCASNSNELYCCALGDPFNWYVFNGDSQDSWAVNVGTTGPFTGICAYQDSVLFFKEDCIHRVYGTRPSNFQVSTIRCQGVEAGSASSVCALNERVYYKSRQGLCVFTGSLPSLLSQPLGETVYKNACASSYKDSIFISMQAVSDPLDRDWETPHGELLVYNTTTGLWHKEGREKPNYLTVYDGNLLLVGEDSGLYSVGPDTSGELESCVHWMAQTGRLLFRTPDHKHISRIQVRASLYEGTNLKIEIRYDSLGPWETVIRKISPVRTGYTFPILPRRCDHFELRLSGEGDMRILGISYTMEQGSDI